MSSRVERFSPVLEAPILAILSAFLFPVWPTWALIQQMSTWVLLPNLLREELHLLSGRGA